MVVLKQVVVELLVVLELDKTYGDPVVAGAGPNPGEVDQEMVGGSEMVEVETTYLQHLEILNHQTVGASRTRCWYQGISGCWLVVAVVVSCRSANTGTGGTGPYAGGGNGAGADYN